MSAVEGWAKYSIEECCEILDNKRIPINGEERELRAGSVPYYGANGLQGFIDGFIFDEDLILIAEDGGNFEEFATRPIAYQISGKSWVNNHAHVLRAKDTFNQTAIFYFLEHKNILPFIVGGTRAKLNQRELKSIEINFPRSEKEQTKIAEILSCIDTAIEQTEAIIAKQQRIKTGLMQDLLSKGIDEHGNIRSEQTHAFKDSPLGRIPVEWEILPLGSFVNGITSGSRGWASYYQSEGALFLRIGNLTRQHINMRFDDVAFVQLPENIEGKRTEVQSGDVLISITADLGIIGVIPENFGIAYVNQHIALIRIKSDELSPRYAGHFLAGYRVQRQIESCNESGAKAGLNLPTISSLLLLKPPTKEQEKIVDILDKADEIQVKEINYLKKLKRQKTALMQDLLSGNVRVNPLLQ